VRDRKSRVAACGGWRDWACATRFVSRRRRKAQGITVGGLKLETPCASALFQGFVEAAKALQKCRRLCPSGWARRRSRGLRLRHLHESSSFGAAVHRASKARTARIGIVKRRYQCTKRRPRGLSLEPSVPLGEKRSFRNASMRELHRAAYRGGRKRYRRGRPTGQPAIRS
jgi:hypothetical protein